MSTTIEPINYAAYLGVESLPAAIVFTILYVPLHAFYIWRVFTKFSFVHLILTGFTQIRVLGFTIRAVLAASATAGTQWGLVITDQILFGVGYTGLLLATLSLECDRERIAGVRPTSRFMRLLLHRRASHLVVIGATALIVAGTTISFEDSPGRQSLGNTLKLVGNWVIFALTVAAAVRAGFLIMVEKAGSNGMINRALFAERRAGFLVLTASAFLLVRMVYTVVTVLKKIQANEASWYPLSMLPELICACIFTLPGLVLSRKELEEKDIELEGYRNRPTSGSPGVV